MSFRLDIELGFRHVWTRPTYPINNNILFFESVNLYTAVISETVCLFRLCLFHVSDFPENTYFPEMLFSGKENIFKCLVALRKML